VCVRVCVCVCVCEHVCACVYVCVRHLCGGVSCSGVAAANVDQDEGAFTLKSAALYSHMGDFCIL